MITAILLLGIANALSAALGHARLSRKIDTTQERILAVVNSSLRLVGPVEAQEKALRAQVQEKALARRLRPDPLNL